MTDERIQRARRAETQALIDQHATDREQMELLAASGVTILGLAAALGGPCPVKGMPPSRPPDPEAVAKVRARIRRRRRLGLPDVDCLDRKCKCGALLDALDQTDESAPKDEVVRAARKLHKRRAGPLRTLPQFRHLLPRPRVEPEPPAARERPQDAASADSRCRRHPDIDQALPPAKALVGWPGRRPFDSRHEILTSLTTEGATMTKHPGDVQGGPRPPLRPTPPPPVAQKAVSSSAAPVPESPGPGQQRPAPAQP